MIDFSVDLEDTKTLVKLEVSGNQRFLVTHFYNQFKIMLTLVLSKREPWRSIHALDESWKYDRKDYLDQGDQDYLDQGDVVTIHLENDAGDIPWDSSISLLVNKNYNYIKRFMIEFHQGHLRLWEFYHTSSYQLRECISKERVTYVMQDLLWECIAFAEKI